MIIVDRFLAIVVKTPIEVCSDPFFFSTLRVVKGVPVQDSSLQTMKRQAEELRARK